MINKTKKIIKLKMALDNYKGEQTILQRFEDKDDLKYVVGHLDTLRSIFFENDNLPYKWEPKLIRFNGKTVFNIVFTLTHKDNVNIDTPINEQFEQAEMKFEKIERYGYPTFNNIMADAINKAFHK